MRALATLLLLGSAASVVVAFLRDVPPRFYLLVLLISLAFAIAGFWAGLLLERSARKMREMLQSGGREEVTESFMYLKGFFQIATLLYLVLLGIWLAEGLRQILRVS